MNHVDRINRVLEYIEANLDTNIDLGLLADKCALSRYHFHRVFKALVGEKPLRYVENRRLSRACNDLLNSDKRIIDIAFDYGFQSHESFIRAFKKTYSLPPSQFRKVRPRVTLQDMCKIGSLDLKLSNGIAKPNPTILHKPAFSITGLTYSGHDTSAINRLWERFCKILKTGNFKVDKNQYLGVCFHDMDMRNNEVFEYYAGFESILSMDIPKDMKMLHIPENDYAVFTHQGPVDKIEMTYNQIYGHWLLLTEYIPTMDLDIIVIDNLFSGNKDSSEVDILIPVNR